MKILVAVKRVIDYNVQVRVKEDGTGVITDNVKMSTNPPDDNAVEEAVKIKELGKAKEIVAVTVGEEKAQETVRKALAVGADRGIHIKVDNIIEPLAVSKILKKIVDNEISILVGTQLISKGFHFPNLNCIVVVDIDLSSQGHDLRGAEKNLQLYHQLSGRAGRTGKPATVYFQTYNLNKNMIIDITNKDPDIFLEKELEIRKKNNLPPFQRFISLILTSNDERKLQKNSTEFKNYIDGKLNSSVLGPVNAPIYKIRKNFRVRLLVRAKKSLNIQKSLSQLIKKFRFEKEIKLSVDVDPISFN